MKSRWIVLLFSLALGREGAALQTSCDTDLQAWLACNNPRVIRYLSNLSERDLRTTLSGVKLSDGSVVLGGYRFLARIKGLAAGVHVYLVEHKGNDFAYAWVGEGGTPVPLPQCPEAFPASVYVLSGDVYTWKELQPGHGVVKVLCVGPKWKAQGEK